MVPGRQGGPGEYSGSDSDGADDRPADPVAAVESALSAFRGRGPGGPFSMGPFGAGPPPFGRGRGWGGPQGGHDAHHHGGAEWHGPHTGHGPRGGRGGGAALRLLAALSKRGPSSVSDLANVIGVDQPRASRLVQSAVDAGHVRREVDPRDARRSILAITEAGRAALAAVLDHRRGAIERALADFTPAEREEFARLFTRFAESWSRGQDA